MRRFILATALLATVVLMVLLGYYKLVLRSPPIPISLGTINLTGRMSEMMDLVNVDDLTVEWNTNGEINFLTDSKKAATISYNLGSLGNATDLAIMYWVPQIDPLMMETLKKVFTPFRLQILANNRFFYYFVPLQLTVNFST